MLKEGKNEDRREWGSGERGKKKKKKKERNFWIEIKYITK